MSCASATDRDGSKRRRPGRASIAWRRLLNTKGPGPLSGSPALLRARRRSQKGIQLLRRQRRLRLVQTPERHHGRNLPLVPHLVHLRLEVIEVLLDEVGEPPLLQEVLADWLARTTLDERLGLA